MESIPVNKDSEKPIDWDSTKIIKAVSFLLLEIIAENKSQAEKQGKEVADLNPKSPFSTKKPPTISILSFFERIIKYTRMEESTLIITLIYIDRVCDMSGLKLNELNIHRVILACVLLSIKYNEDDYYTNDYYARVGGISLQEMNTLELEAILLLKHTLFVEEEFFKKYKVYLKHYLK